MAIAPYIWDKRPNPHSAEFKAGVVREEQEQRCEESYQTVMAPPCPACGQPVSDTDWPAHKYTKHQINESVQPWGRPDSREAVFLGGSRENLAEKIARWSSRHPGVTLLLLGQGTERRGKVLLFWQRYRVKGQ